ncbi:phosphoribosyltransferase family protein [Cytophagaceae bacterium DM2B3-1]|uniref:Phosphoribosyltransferase family protein n=1 Tax=Xanthocytophaga flava TaxID=3048013 RepID=A0ABT7CE42_9BACT|nr:phosphoribosyltransferase family protein [Xanthocytophaga flavus]MDJ1491998.1 phosphoribosyltransferase family protein [Xanthocytophaga flavus]
MSLFDDFLELIFPEYCLMCNGSLLKNEKQICLYCRYHLPVTNYHNDPNNALMQRFAGKVNIKYAWAFLKFTKGGKVQNVLHHLKYNGKKDAGILLGKWYGSELRKREYHTEFDSIIPVPLHASKLKKRGYNQCDPIVAGLSLQLGVAAYPIALKRNIHNPSQTQLSRMERYENTKDIFEVADYESVRDKRILLVDDIVTTGSTLESCIMALQKAKCKEVSIACLAAAQ